MKAKIIHYIETLEKEKDIRILLACETGSRAWGFPSPDSDFDVRLIYVHQRDWYLGLAEKKDSLEIFFENNDLDFSGWDLRKCLRLLMKSNASLLERIQSPIIYKSDDSFMAEIMDVAGDCYSRIATIHHYLNLSRNCLREIDAEGKYKLKKFFYALRAATACQWILEKETIPPIEFRKMLDGLQIKDAMLKRISELTELKSTVGESYLHTGEKELFEFIHENILKAEENRTNLPTSKADLEHLDNLFLKNLIPKE